MGSARSPPPRRADRCRSPVWPWWWRCSWRGLLVVDCGLRLAGAARPRRDATDPVRLSPGACPPSVVGTERHPFPHGGRGRSGTPPDRTGLATVRSSCCPSALTGTGARQIRPRPGAGSGTGGEAQRSGRWRVCGGPRATKVLTDHGLDAALPVATGRCPVRSVSSAPRRTTVVTG